jgi:hypothetical protein
MVEIINNSSKKVQMKKEEYESQFLPNRVDEQYKLCGWTIFSILIVVFLVVAITFITLKYKARENPAVALEVERPDILELPKQLIICPFTKNELEWHFYDLLYLQNAQLVDTGGAPIEANVFYSEKANLDCLNISLANIQTFGSPAAIELSLVWSQAVDSYSDIYVSFDEELLGSAYMASGLYNHSKGVSNNIELKLEEHTFLPSSNSPIQARWVLQISSAAYYFYTLSENATAISCSNTSGLLHTKGCSANFTTCSDNLRDNQNFPCAMMTAIYVHIPTTVITNFAEVDPVNWQDIVASLGGYWVYVGTVFSLFFAVKKGTNRLIPVKVVKLFMGSCFTNQNSPNASRNPVTAVASKQAKSFVEF